jgi:outer membrane protein assembly factor BamB
MPNTQVVHRHRIWGFIACLSLVLFSASTSLARAEPSWTTYHRDAQRSGDDPDATQPIEPALAWQTGDLGAPIWSQPLVLGDRVYVATVGDVAYALEASTGKVIWEKSLGTPVPAEDLPCGDVKPSVGVVGTPAIDPAKQTIYMVADTLNTKGEIEHLLKGLSLSNGEETVSRNVDPPGADPKALLQRTALNLDEGNVVFGYGGNDGDCSDYRGTVIAAPENGGQPRFWQYQPAPPSSAGGAVWSPAGPSVDAAGKVYATTGNPDPPAGEPAITFDYSDSVVKLDLAEDFVADPATELASPLGWFEPPNWEEESNNDLDLSSAAAELLPGALLFQAGKDGVGYLIDEATMESGAPAVDSHPVCKEHGGFPGSFGGDSFADGTLYIPCENGVQALAYSESAKTITPLWQGPEDAVGSPIVSAGLVWTIATGRFSGGGTTLYGLDPTSGTPRYTETLPSPTIDHFASPSAAGGHLFVATGCSVTAYQVSQLAGSPTGGGGTPVPCQAAAEEPEVANGEPEKTEPPGPPTVTDVAKRGAIEKVTSGSGVGNSQPPAHAPTRLVNARLLASHTGLVKVALLCTWPIPCRGTIDLRARLTPSALHKGKHTIFIQLVRAHFGPATGRFEFKLRLDRAALALLQRHHRLSVLVTIKVTGAPLVRETLALLT